MMTRPVLTSGPAESPVSLQEAKDHVRAVGFGDDDVLILSMIDAAVSYLDGWDGVLGRCIVTQTWTAGLSSWPASIGLPFPDVSGVAISYYDANGDQQTVSPSLYEVVATHNGGAVFFKDAWDSPSLYADMEYPVSVAITSGYGAASDVPMALKMAILMLVGQYYENREAASKSAMSEMPLGFKTLIAPFRFRVV